MRTIIYTLFFVCITSFAAQAQQLLGGPIMGLNYNSLHFNESFTVDDEAFQFQTDNGGIGVMAGAFARLEYKKVFTELSFVFSQEKSEAILTGDRFSHRQDISFSRIYLPLKVGYVVDDKFNIFAGAKLNQMVDGSFIPSNDLVYANYNKSNTPLSAGYFFGVGFEIEQFNLNLNYSGNLGGNSIETSYKRQLFAFDQKDRMVSFTLTYDLPIKIFDKKEEDIYFKSKENIIVTD